MDIKTKNLFIDTQFFYGEQFNFNSKVISSLSNLAKLGHINLFITDLTLIEIENKIKKKINTAFKKISTSDCRILNNLPEYSKFIDIYLPQN